MSGFIKRAPGSKRLSMPVSEPQVDTIAKSAELWFMSAASLRNAARHLKGEVDWGLILMHGSEDDHPAGAMRGFLMAAPLLLLYGMAMESFLKARHIARSTGFDPTTERSRWWNGHELIALANETNFDLSQFSQKQMHLIEDISAAIQLGRYPYHKGIRRAGTGWDLTSGEQIDSIVEVALKAAFLEIDNNVYAKEALEELRKATEMGLPKESD